MSRILVVEDSPVVRALVREVLEQAGFTVTTVEDGVEALDQLARQAFAAVVSDVHMPRMDGLELLGRLRGMPRPPPVVLLTADDTPETVLRAVRAQALQYLPKPMAREHLVDLVRKALGSAPPLPIEVLSAQPHWVELLVPCERASADRIEGFLRQLRGDLADDVRESVGRVFRELLLNAIEWGGQLDASRRVRIAYLRGKRLLLYRIADPGEGFRFDTIPHAAVSNPPDDPLAHAQVREAKGLRAGGLGLLIASAEADELLYNEAHNEVVFVKYLDG
jgi:CheY-like chemotaxis protein/anti-sigma regulatory factor (Ser/Thr protein kinase)